MFEEAKRQRAMRPEIRSKREALAVVRPLHEQIRAWQLKTAHFTGLAARTRGNGLHRPEYLVEAQMLSQKVAAARSSLGRQVAESPDALAKNSRIVDTTRSLESMAANLKQAIDLLQGVNRG